MALVTVVYHHEDGAWWAESDDMPGMTAVSDHFGETQQLVREAVAEYFDAAAVDLIERLESGAAIVDTQFAAIIQGASVVALAPRAAATYATRSSSSFDRVKVVDVRLSSPVTVAQ